MPDDSTAPGLVGRVREVFEALSSGDFDALTTLCARDAVYESVAMGATFEGVAAIREFVEDMVGAHDAFDAKIEENLDLGSGIGLAVVHQTGRPAGSSFEAAMRYAAVSDWVEDLLVRITMYTDIDAGRAAAQRLAEERGMPGR
jgi:ketosteroid isomerase-like protein